MNYETNTLYRHESENGYCLARRPMPVPAKAACKRCGATSLEWRKSKKGKWFLWECVVIGVRRYHNGIGEWMPSGTVPEHNFHFLTCPASNIGTKMPVDFDVVENWLALGVYLFDEAGEERTDTDEPTDHKDHALAGCVYGGDRSLTDLAAMLGDIADDKCEVCDKRTCGH